MKRAMAVAAALLAALGVLEVGLRLAGYGAPQLHQPDPQLGWSLRAHKRGAYLGEDGRTQVITNGAGFRDREHQLDKPDPVYRIAVLGDDYSEAASVALQDTWWWRLEPKLQYCDFQPGKLVEILNFGVAGYGTAQELVLLQSTVMRYAPDLVLLQVASDDVIDNSSALTPNKLRPFYFLDAHGVPRIDESFAAAPEFQRHLQTRYRLAAEIADHTRAFQLAREVAGRAFIAPAHAEEAPLGAPADAEHEQAWRVTEALIGKINDYVRRNGAELQLVVVPPARQARERMSYADQRLAALGNRLHAPVTPLGGELRSAYYRPSGAWTVEGHRAAAAALAQRLCPATAPPG
ncbi:MAG: SGNH/GDSL hydrolase family protein [Betaproteobacteria bacterium]|nr:MAG: SGNH/GDSL hydrolase family protein [Betaproteobacteria bacterium]